MKNKIYNNMILEFTSKLFIKYLFLKVFTRASLFIILCSIIVILSSCGQADNSTATDTPTSGSIHICADDAFKPFIDAEIKVFEALYRGTSIEVKYETEDSVFKDLLSHDSLRLAITARKLTKEEEDYLHSKALYPEQIKIATDAIALIVNNINPDSVLNIGQINEIFSGDSAWHNIDGSSKLGKITVVFDHENSSNSRYIKDSILHGHKFPSFCFAVNSNEKVIDYVNKNINAMGIISANWISDGYDSTVMKFLSQVKVVGISKYINADETENYYQPYLAYLKMGDYALQRNVYVVKTEARVGLGSGFLSFITADQGQRIIMRAGLLPATVPTHILNY